jgi:hypothetical protein
MMTERLTRKCLDYFEIYFFAYARKELIAYPRPNLKYKKEVVN